MKLASAKYSTFPATALRPEGWLKQQLRIQAEGLSGNLDKIWPDIRDSRWIGGPCEGWERVPYWLDGFTPLAWLLDDEDLKARAKRYIDGILERQKPDDWNYQTMPVKMKPYGCTNLRMTELPKF